MRTLIVAASVFFVMALAIGCAPAPEPTPVPTETPIPPTATPIPPTATLVPPTATAKPKVAVPSVVGQTADSATANLQKAGLEVERIETPASSCMPTVMRQNPEMGAMVEPGTAVRIFICVGPTPTPITPTSVPPTATPKPTPVPTRALPSCADTPPGMAGLLWINQFDGEATVTIVDHEYHVPGKTRMLIPIPAGKKFVIDAFIPGVGRLRPAPGPFTWDAGYCEVWNPGRAPN